MPNPLKEPKVTKGAVCAALEGKTARERGQIKAAALAARPIPARYAHGPIEVEILSLAPWGENGFEVTARVWRGGDELPLGDLNPARIAGDQIPILVPDGTRSEVEVPFGGGTKVTTVDNFKEDLDAALRLLVGEHFRACVEAKK